jgi:hypothetical protein
LTGGAGTEKLLGPEEELLGRRWSQW